MRLIDGDKLLNVINDMQLVSTNAWETAYPCGDVLDAILNAQTIEIDNGFARKDGWHKVSEELPPEDEIVVICLKGHWTIRDYELATLQIYEGAYFDCDGNEYSLDEVEYWAFIVPPKENDGD